MTGCIAKYRRAFPDINIVVAQGAGGDSSAAGIGCIPGYRDTLHGQCGVVVNVDRAAGHIVDFVICDLVVHKRTAMNVHRDSSRIVIHRYTAVDADRNRTAMVDRGVTFESTVVHFHLHTAWLSTGCIIHTVNFNSKRTALTVIFIRTVCYRSFIVCEHRHDRRIIRFPQRQCTAKLADCAAVKVCFITTEIRFTDRNRQLLADLLHTENRTAGIF